jgi:hypothetical protein
MAHTVPKTFSASPDSAPLTGLERDLLTYVERLTAASEASATQFAALERRSTGQISARLDDLETCVSSLLRSQIMLMGAFAKLAGGSAGSSTLPSDWSEEDRALNEAARRLSQAAT